MDDAGRAEGGTPRARRRHRGTEGVAAALLLCAGSAAVVLGVRDQDRAPHLPPAAAVGTPYAEPAPASASASPQARTARNLVARARAKRVALPVELRIPAIGVRSTLTRVGLAADGSLEVPQPGPDYDKAAWFDRSPRPGATGPAVIEGHIDGRVNGPSVFFRLAELRPGDRVSVLREDGSVARFVIDAVRSFPKDDFPTLSVYGNTAGPELRLITCGGAFDADRPGGGYLANTVVYAHSA
jgi:hypothetical protein